MIHELFNFKYLYFRRSNERFEKAGYASTVSIYSNVKYKDIS